MKAIPWVKTIPLRVQLTCIGCAYAAVLAYAIATEYARHLAELRDPVYSSAGMWAFGDELLAWSIFFFFLVPTFFLLLLMRRYERVYIRYSRMAFWFSLSSPFCLAVFALGAVARAQNIADPLLWRNWRAPFAVMLMVVSRLVARVDVAKRLLTRACLIEGGAFAVFVTLIIFSGK